MKFDSQATQEGSRTYRVKTFNRLLLQCARFGEVEKKKKICKMHSNLPQFRFTYPCVLYKCSLRHVAHYTPVVRLVEFLEDILLKSDQK